MVDRRPMGRTFGAVVSFAMISAFVVPVAFVSYAMIANAVLVSVFVEIAKVATASVSFSQARKTIWIDDKRTWKGYPPLIGYEYPPLL